MLNSIIVIGRLIHNPEFRTTTKGTFTARFSIACHRDFNKDETDYFECTAWRKKAEFISKYFQKGQLVAVRGRMENHPFEKNGEKKPSWGIQVEDAWFCDSKKEEPKQIVQSTFDELDDDEEIPF